MAGQDDVLHRVKRSGMEVKMDYTNIEETKEKKKPSRQRKWFLLICAASVLVALGIFVLLMNGYINKRYNSYEVLASFERQDSNTVNYTSVDGRLIKYSKDGISEINSKGETVWNASYDMDNPQLSYCGQYILVADIGGKDAVIYHEGDTGQELSVDYEIQQACVSRQGVVALMLQDKTSDMIHLYNPYDVSSELLAEIPTNVEDGYPIVMALSPDGMSVVASYLCVTDGNAESRVAFYNFSDVGQSKDWLVGARNYEDDLISDIRFLDDSRVCLLGGGSFYIWDNMKKPEQIVTKTLKKEIRSVIYDEKRVGFILETEEEKTPYEMQIYNADNGKKTMDIRFDNDYDSVSISGNEILLYSEHQISIFKLNGVERLNCTMDGTVSWFFRAQKRNRYYLIDDSQIQLIKLKNE